MNDQMVTLASVVVTDFVGGAVLAGLAALHAHAVNADPLRPALLAAAADGLAHALGSNRFNLKL
jgi:hypothetical protein